MKLPGWAQKWLQDLREVPAPDLGKGRRAVRYAVGLVRYSAHQVSVERARQMAAALTYHTLFSILPTAALILVALHAYVGPQGQTQFKETVSEWILSPVGTEGEDEDSAPRETAEEVADRRAEFEDARRALEVRLEQAFKYLERIDFSSIGFVGFLLFIWGATALVATVEGAFNRIFSSPRGRRWYRRLTLYYAIITLGPIVIMAGLWLRSELLSRLESGAMTSWIAPVMVVLSPLFTSWLVLFVLFVAVPNTRVKARAAAVGAIVAAILSGIALELFRMYLGRAALTTLYGALALIPLSLLWIYLSWLIILFGLELTYAVQTFPGPSFEIERRKREIESIVDPSWTLPVAIQVASRFETGELTRVGDLEEALDLPRHVLQRLLTELERSEVVVRVETDTSAGYSLARPANRLALSTILEAEQRLRADQQPPPEQPELAALLAQRYDAEVQASREKTLADFVANAPDATT